MTTVVQCPCGFTVRSEDRKSIVSQAQRHAKEAHGMELTEEQALAMSRPE
jgi:predicted small metal-binding protein